MLFSISVPLSFAWVLAELWFYVFDMTFSASTLRREKDRANFFSTYTLHKGGGILWGFVCLLCLFLNHYKGLFYFSILLNMALISLC